MDLEVHTVRGALICPEPEFATRAVLAVFGRTPTIEQTLEVYERRAAGGSRAAILRSLLRSAAEEQLPVPDDWALVLPRRIDVSHLVASAASGADFVSDAYRMILGRTPSAEEISVQIRHLRWPKTRSDLLVGLASSPEAESTGGDISLVGIGRRGPSLKRFIERFRSESAGAPPVAESPADSIRRECRRLEKTLANLLTQTLANLLTHSQQAAERLIDNMNARGDQLSALTRQLSVVENTIGRLRVRLETEGAKTSEVASDTKVISEALRSLHRSLDSMGSDLAQQVHELERRSHDVLAATDPIRSLIDGFRNVERGHEALRQTVERILSASNDSRDSTQHLSESVAQSFQSTMHILQCLAGLPETLGGVAASVSTAEQTLTSLDRRVLPPVVPGGDTVVAQVDGFFLGIPAREWRLSTYYHNRGPLEPGLYKYFQKTVRPGMTVVDVGANVGLYTLVSARFLRGNGTVVSYEPTPEIFGLLRNNVQLNGFAEAGNVRVQNAAVTDECGTVELYADMADSTRNSLFPTPDQSHRISVPSVSLDEALAGLERVDLVKIDVEGCEPLVVKGMRHVIDRNAGLRIVMEFAPAHIVRSGTDPSTFLRELQSMGLTISVLHGITGDVVAVSEAALLAADTANLLLVRA